MTLNEDRLGLAYVRGNKWGWDEEVFGPKPDAFDDMTHDEKNISFARNSMQSSIFSGRPQQTKHGGSMNCIALKKNGKNGFFLKKNK